ncbi:hypothetical protein ACK3BK_09165 [Pseudomonas sp. L7]|uniref:hypothetical protein n=1 Tax=Pseudomonas sp. L7 TaxID=3388343 RepID=UPI0039856B20
MNVTALHSNPETDYRAAMQQAAVAFLLRHRGEHLTGDDQVLNNCTRYLPQSLEVPSSSCRALLNWRSLNSKG